MARRQSELRLTVIWDYKLKAKSLADKLEVEQAATIKATAKLRTAEDLARIAREHNETLQEKIITLEKKLEAQSKSTADAQTDPQDARERVAAAEAQSEENQRRICELETAQAAEVQSTLDHQTEAAAASERATQLAVLLEQAQAAIAREKVEAQERVEVLEQEVAVAHVASSPVDLAKIDSLTTKLEDAQRKIDDLRAELEQDRRQQSAVARSIADLATIELREENATLRQELAQARKGLDEKDAAYKRLNKQNGHMTVHYKCLHGAIQKLKAEGEAIDPRAAAAPTLERLHSIVDFILSEPSAGPAAGAGVGLRQPG